MTEPIGTTSFTLNRISSITPAAVLGTSLSTLSVAISSTVSSIFTGSPGCLNHLRMVASIILSPNFGITRSITAIGFSLCKLTVNSEQVYSCRGKDNKLILKGLSTVSQNEFTQEIEGHMGGLADIPFT